jgi:hypothetical protein
MALYMGARAKFSNVFFPVMGNHECTGADTSNCGAGNTNGTTNNFTQFMSKMLAPLGQTKPYYTIDINGTNNAWTAKFVFVACNAWDATQSAWLDSELAKTTRYTFVIRHEGSLATTAPCVTPSAAIIAAHPLSLLIVGHTHTFSYYPSEKQLVVGNGGAPLSGNINYGYVLIQQQQDKSFKIREFQYDTNVELLTYSFFP